MTTAVPDPACELAHGASPAEVETRTLVAVFVSPVGSYLLHFGRDLGYRTVLVDPDGVTGADGARHADLVAKDLDAGFIDATTDIVVTDHDRAELGPILRDALGLPARWIGVMGSVRHPAPHPVALRQLGVAEDDIARVHRPIGLNIGSHTPAEIAIATLAGLIADRNGRPGGFAW
jgi:xanthine dehydrogenase accessory factor